MIHTFRTTELTAMGVILRGPSVLLIGCLTVTGCASLSSTETRLAELRQEGSQAMQVGDHATASTALRQAYELDAENASTLELLLPLYNQMGDRNGEASIALQLLAVDPDHPRALTTMGQLALQQGNVTVAAEHLERSTESDPEQWAAWNGLGIIADSEGRHAEAQMHFHRSLRILPGHPKVLANLGWSLLLSGHYAEAEEQFRESLSIEPESKITRSNLAYALALQGNYRQAEEYYLQLYDEAITANNLGQAAVQRGETDVARAYLQRAMRLSPRYYEKAAQALQQIDSDVPSPTLTLP